MWLETCFERVFWPIEAGCYTEDDVRVAPEFVVLAHGMGAIGGQGKPAAKLSVWSVIGEMEAADPETGPTERLHAGLERAHEAVTRLSLGWGGLRRPVSTIAVLRLHGSQVSAAHVGDCRISLWRDGRLRALTVDRTVGGVWSAAPAEVASSPVCVLGGPDHSAEIQILDVAEGDLFLLSGPRLHQTLSDSEIEVSLQRADQGAPLAPMCRSLIRATEARITHGAVALALARVRDGGPVRSTSGGSSHRPGRSWLFQPGEPLPDVPRKWRGDTATRGPDASWFREVFDRVMGEDD